MDAIQQFYSQNKEKFSEKYNELNKQLKWFIWFRLLAFVCIFLPVFIWGISNWFSIAGALFFMVLFFFLVKKNIQLEKKKEKFAALKTIVEDEILALNHQFSQFKKGEQFLNTDHFYSYDLDLFGSGSLFQFLNRTTTKGGYFNLANWLMQAPLDKKEIEDKQAAIAELSKNPGWRLDFLASGKLFDETEELSHEIKSWSVTNIGLGNHKFLKYAKIGVPAVTVISAVPSILGISDFYLVVAIFIQWILLFIHWKVVSKFFQLFGRKSELLGKYMQLVQIIEDTEFHSSYLLRLQKKVKEPETASNTFQQLKSLVKQFEYRQNLLIGFFLNSFFLWDIRCVYKLWKWHQLNGRKMGAWIDVIAEFDALVSLSNYANNHPDFVFPEIQEGDFIFQGKELGHPLLHPRKRVCNTLEIKGWSKVMIVTGANMAGKSTFLRTVGVNLLLARLGAPVCAREMKLTPTSLYTNMRTTDSLLKDESYFFAELKRIKGVLDRLENGERIFVILDEMLKGTNSVDKLNGSQELIKKLLQLKSVSLIATHDLKLSEMEDQFPQQVFNKCFEIRIENNELVFDYILSDGVTQHMNASFLMKKMGII